jgi:AcrR family transcriptional regulator
MEVIKMVKRKAPDVRRKEILEAALKCFSKRGYHVTTVEDIVKRSKLSKGGLYWYFKSKKDIFISLIQEKLKEDQIFWNNLLKEHEVGPQFLIDAGIKYLNYYFNSKYRLKFFIEFINGAIRDEEIRRKVSKLHKKWREMIKEAFEYAISKNTIKKVDSESLSLSLIAMVEGIIILYAVSKKKLDYEKIWKEFAKSLLEGIKP